jgi:ComF family protein
MKMLETLKEALFIENGRCPICKRVLFFTKDHICIDCVKKLERPSGREAAEMFPGDPSKRRHGVYLYKGNIKEITHLMKFDNRPGLCSFMGKLVGRELALFERQDELEELDLIIPVPLHLNGIKERGYNQSELMAMEIKSELSKKNLALRSKVAIDVLVKTRDTPHQRDLKKSERLVNVKDAFEIKNPEMIRGRKVLLVDDICTTGATVHACREAILKEGASSVVVVVMAVVEI